METDGRFRLCKLDGLIKLVRRIGDWRCAIAASLYGLNSMPDVLFELGTEFNPYRPIMW